MSTTQTAKTGNPMIDNPASWVIREKATGRVILETYERKVLDHLNTRRYEAVPIAQHLGELNTAIKRLYHLQAVTSRTGRTVRVTGYPMTHAECCTMKGKFTAHKDGHIELVEHREGTA